MKRHKKTPLKVSEICRHGFQPRRQMTTQSKFERSSNKIKTVYLRYTYRYKKDAQINIYSSELSNSVFLLLTCSSALTEV